MSCQAFQRFLEFCSCICCPIHARTWPFIRREDTEPFHLHVLKIIKNLIEKHLSEYGKIKLPDGRQDSELNQWNPYGKHLQLQESVYVHPLAAQLDEHWYDTLRLFDHQHNMCHCNSGLHGQKGPRHHQNSAAKNIYRSARGQKLPHTIFPEDVWIWRTDIQHIYVPIH